jgi:hypothetical protein
MFHTHVASVCSECFICFRLMLHLSVSCCKCFKRYVQGVMGHGPGAKEGAQRSGGQWIGRTVHLGSCRRGVLVLIPTLGSRRVERAEGIRGRSSGRRVRYMCGVGRGERGPTHVCNNERRITKHRWAGGLVIEAGVT